MQKSGQWLYKAYESILCVYSYRRVPKEMRGLWNIIGTYANTGMRWTTYSRAYKSEKRIHLKALTARHEQSYPTVRTGKSAHLIRHKMGKIKVLTLHKLRSDDRKLRT